MEELRLLVEMVANLPTMAIWVLIGFFIYKTVIVGSIFGVTRLAVVKTHDWLTTPKDKIIKTHLYKDLSGAVIDGCYAELVTQVRRIRNKGTDYIHSGDVAWLEKAITEKRERDAEVKTARQ